MEAHNPATPAAMYKMVPIPEAQEIVLRETCANEIIEVPLHQGLGSVLARDVLAKDDLPPFPASIKVAICLKTMHIHNALQLSIPDQIRSI